MSGALLSGFCSAFVVLYGLWSILANVAVYTGMSFHTLRTLTPAVPALALMAWVVLRLRVRRSRAGGTGPPDPTPAETPLRPNLPGFFAAGLAAGLAAWWGPFGPVWAAVCLLLAVVFRAHLKGEPLRVSPPAPLSRSEGLLVLTCVLVAVAAVLFLHRPDEDDSLYLNMAVSVLERPDAAMFDRDRDALHAVPGGGCAPHYQVQTLDLFRSLIATAAGVEPIWVAHALLPPLFALLCVLAASGLLRFLLGRRWAWGLVSLMSVLFLADTTHRMYGNFAFVRLFQGKAVFITVLVPLIVHYAVRFSAAPRFSTWALLFLAQACAVGMTCNALYAAPLCAGLALAACWRPERAAWRRLGLGLLASAHPVVMGLLVRHYIHRKMLEMGGVGTFQDLGPAMEAVIGRGFSAWLWLWCLWGGWALAAGRAERRWLLGLSLGFTALLLNPFLAEFWATRATGAHLLWRVFWAVPLPWMAAAALTSLALAGSRQGASRARSLLPRAALGLLLAAAVAGEVRTAASGPDGSRFHPVGLALPGLKVPPGPFAAARLAVDLAGRGQTVLVPDDVSPWVVTLRGHPFPVVARPIYTRALLYLYARWTDAEELKERLTLHAYISGTGDVERGEAVLRKWIREREIRVIVAPAGWDGLGRLCALLRRNGYLSGRFLDYQVFYRGDGWPAAARGRMAAGGCPDPQGPVDELQPGRPPEERVGIPGFRGVSSSRA